MTDDFGESGPDSITVPGDDGSTLIAADLNTAVPGFDTLVARYADGSSLLFEDLGSGSTLVGINGADGFDQVYLVEGSQAWAVDPATGVRLYEVDPATVPTPPLPEAQVAAPEVPVWAQGIGDGSSIAVDNSSSISFPSQGETTMPLTLDSSISYPDQGDTTTQFEIGSSLTPGILDSPSFEMDLSTLPAAPASTDIAPNGPAVPGSGAPSTDQLLELIRLRDQATDPGQKEALTRVIEYWQNAPRTLDFS